MERYIGFYTSRPFWAGDKPDFSRKISQEEFHNIMSEEIFTFSNEQYSLKICKDGLFLFQITAISEGIISALGNRNVAYEKEWWSIYLNHLNCIYLLFESAILQEMRLVYFEISEITNKDAFAIWFDGNRIGGYSNAELSVAYKYQSARFLSSYMSYPELPINQSIETDERIMRRPRINRNVFNRLIEDLNKIYGDFDKIKMLSNLAKSLSEYKISDYDTSLILSWFIIESYLSKKWKNRLESLNCTFPDESRRINSERMKNFLERDYPISTIINLLELFGDIQFNDYRMINNLRIKRNKIVHPGDSKCNSEDCTDAFRVINLFISEIMDIKLELNTCFTFGRL